MEKDQGREALLAAEARKNEMQKKALELIKSGAGAFSDVAETLGVTDIVEKAVVEELAYCEQRNNTSMLSTASSRDESREIEAIKRSLERILMKIGKPGYIADLKAIAEVDYSAAMDKRRADEMRRRGQ